MLLKKAHLHSLVGQDNLEYVLLHHFNVELVELRTHHGVVLKLALVLLPRAPGRNSSDPLVCH